MVLSLSGFCSKEFKESSISFEMSSKSIFIDNILLETELNFCELFEILSIEFFNLDKDEINPMSSSEIICEL